MAKWCGKVGFITTVKTEPGIWEPTPVEATYYGDTIRISNRWANSGTNLIGDITVNIQISIMADPFATQNFQHIRYVEFMGTMWSVTSADPQYPRIILTLGGVYNGQQATTAE